MSSIGESDLIVSTRICGKFRVLNIFPESAVYPRLGLTLGCALATPSEPFFSGSSATSFELRGLSGELRLLEASSIVG